MTAAPTETSLDARPLDARPLDNRPLDTYPVNLRLRGRRLLVVGGGPVAAAKVSRFLPTGALITVVAPEAVPDIADEPALTWHRRPYRRGEVASYRLAITCTGDPEVDGQVYRDGEAAGVWVNSADDVDRCSFYLPAVARRGPVSVAVGTDGTSPALAAFLRRRLQSELDDGIEHLAVLLARARSALRARAGTSEHPGWRQALDDADLLTLVRSGRSGEAREVLARALGLDDGDLEPDQDAVSGEASR